MNLNLEPSIQSATKKLLTHPVINTHASTSVTTPILRRIGRTNAHMVQPAVSGRGRIVDLDLRSRGLARKSHAEKAVKETTIGQ